MQPHDENKGYEGSVHRARRLAGVAYDLRWPRRTMTATITKKSRANRKVKTVIAHSAVPRSRNKRSAPVTKTIKKPRRKAAWPKLLLTIFAPAFLTVRDCPAVSDRGRPRIQSNRRLGHQLNRLMLAHRASDTTALDNRFELRGPYVTLAGHRIGTTRMERTPRRQLQ